MRPLRRPRRRLATPLVGVVLLAVAGGCSPDSSDGGQVAVTTGDRVAEVRAARAALAEPVPAVQAEARRLVEALEEVWTREASSDERADLAGALRTEPFREAVDELDAVELEGDGPDVVAATEVSDVLVADAQRLLAAVEVELESLAEVSPFDQELENLLEGWDQRGSYSQQLAAFEQLAVDAESLAEDAAGRSAVPACVELWPRRAQAAGVVAERTRELRSLIRDRRGQEFDQLRDEYGQDPYGYGQLLGVLDAQAADACWVDASEAPAALDQIADQVEDLAGALDPADLGG